MWSRPSIYRSFSGLFINLSAGWLTTVFILPIQGLLGTVSLFQLTLNLLYGIVCLVVSVYLDERSQL